MQAFYKRLLKCINSAALRDGAWQLLECASVAKGNESWDGFIAWAWQGRDGERLLVVVNYAPLQAQCYRHQEKKAIDVAPGRIAPPHLQGFVGALFVVPGDGDLDLDLIGAFDCWTRMPCASVL